MRFGMREFYRLNMTANNKIERCIHHTAIFLL